ncbi:unnamed protein product, partial [Brenthis ino]
MVFSLRCVYSYIHTEIQREGTGNQPGEALNPRRLYVNKGHSESQESTRFKHEELSDRGSSLEIRQYRQ